ncbi:hypothetical protein ACFVYA_36975, partial [Amycolatopsis sp. NPDC058278]|uniref:hypothetical protein n=1 Tax=Amycolatopsis sp. NPDC058278 TaxID=3346417 RepID=UPI0036D86B98
MAAPAAAPPALPMNRRRDSARREDRGIEYSWKSVVVPIVAFGFAPIQGLLTPLSADSDDSAVGPDHLAVDPA